MPNSSNCRSRTALLIAACGACVLVSVQAQTEPAADAFQSSNPEAVPGEFIPADNPGFSYEGRFDRSNLSGPVAIWQASRIRTDFEGASLGIRFEPVDGESYFNVWVDGKPSVLGPAKGETRTWLYRPELAPGRHTLTIYKRSEASLGAARFLGLDVAEGSRLVPPASPDYQAKILFLGDSITAGACNEDGAEDQWENRRTHNAQCSYAQFVADALNADLRNISVSGMGVVTGYVTVTADEIWDRVYPKANSPRADLKAWVPDIVFVNFGENDDSITRGRGKPFPSTWTERYAGLVRRIRGAWPDAEIVLLRGGMYGGAKSEPLRDAWNAAAMELQLNDPKVASFAFKHWSGTHPRVSDDRAMAAELVSWCKRQPWLEH